MVFWSKSTAKGQSLAFPSAGDSRWLVQAKALVPWRYGQGCLIFTFMQRCEVSYSRVQNVPGSGSWRFEVWNGCDSGMIRVWFAEHYSAHRIRSRQELQRPVSTRSWSMQTVSAATMKLQRPVSTEAVFNLLVCTWQPDCGDGGRDGAKGA